jgi:hypothetical protein
MKVLPEKQVSLYQAVRRAKCSSLLYPIRSPETRSPTYHGRIDGYWWRVIPLFSFYVRIVASGIALDDRGFDSRQGLGSFLFTTASRPALGPTQPPIQWVLGSLSLGVYRPRRETDHSPPSSAEVRNAWSYTSTYTSTCMTQYCSELMWLM